MCEHARRVESELPILSLVVAGPIDRWEGVLLMDPTMQDPPWWTTSRAWVTDEAAGIAYQMPPVPALRVSAYAPEGAHLAVIMDSVAPDEGSRVYESVLDVGVHGLKLRVGAVSLVLQLAPGTYPVAVWADGDSPETTRRVTVVLGERTANVERTPLDAVREPRFLTRDELGADIAEDAFEPMGVVRELERAAQEWSHLARVVGMFSQAGLQSSPRDLASGARPESLFASVSLDLLNGLVSAAATLFACVQRLALAGGDPEQRASLGGMLETLSGAVLRLSDPAQPPGIGEVHAALAEVNAAVAEASTRWLGDLA